MQMVYTNDKSGGRFPRRNQGGEYVTASNTRENIWYRAPGSVRSCGVYELSRNNEDTEPSAKGR